MIRHLAAATVVLLTLSIAAGTPAAAEDPTTTTTIPAPEPPAVAPEPLPEPPPAPPAPPTWDEIVAFYRTLLPPVPAGSGDGRRIVYTVSGQRVWLVGEANDVQYSYQVSGRAAMPAAGTYAIYSKSRFAFSGSVRMQFMMRFARGRKLAIGFHSIPVRRNGSPLQSEAELGQYRSHGCVRQALSDAALAWDWAPVGTRVVVLG